MKLLRGCFQGTLDFRCRITVPVPFRAALGAVPLGIVFRGECVEILPTALLAPPGQEHIGSAADVRSPIKGRSRANQLAKPEGPPAVVAETRIGRDGRLRLPAKLAPNLREHGNQVLMLGCVNFFQIWDRVSLQNHLLRVPSWSEKDEETLRSLGV